MALKANMTSRVSETSPYMPKIHYGINHVMVSHKGDKENMLVILDNGEQRLITFSLPSPCKLRELLDQVGIEIGAEDRVDCIENSGSEIKYIVKIGNYQTYDTTKMIKAAENHIRQQTAQQK